MNWSIAVMLRDVVVVKPTRSRSMALDVMTMKRVASFSISMHKCSSVLIVIGFRLANRDSAMSYGLRLAVLLGVKAPLH